MFNHKMSKTKLAVSLTSLLLGLGWASPGMSHVEVVEDASTASRTIPFSETSLLSEERGSLVAQSTPRIYQSVSSNEIDSILDRAELFYRRETNTLFIIRSGDLTYLLSLEVCSNQRPGTDCSVIDIAASFQFERAPNLGRINDWNRGRRAKAFILEDNRVLLERSIILLGGVTYSNIASNIGLFFLEAETFVEFSDWGN